MKRIKVRSQARQSGIRFQGRLRIFEKVGERLILRRDTGNKIVNTGLNLGLDFLIGSGSPLGIEYLALGTGTTAAAAANTTLQTETYRETVDTKVRVGQIITVTTTLGTTEGNGNTFTEAGMFGNGASTTPNSGTLITRTTFAGVAKTASNQFVWEWTISATSTN